MLLFSLLLLLLLLLLCCIASYLIELQSYPSQPRQNNLFFHDGDVTASEFFCDTSRLGTDGTDPATCVVTTVNPTDDIYECVRRMRACGAP